MIWQITLAPAPHLRSVAIDIGIAQDKKQRLVVVPVVGVTKLVEPIPLDKFSLHAGNRESCHTAKDFVDLTEHGASSSPGHENRLSCEERIAIHKPPAFGLTFNQAAKV